MEPLKAVCQLTPAAVSAVCRAMCEAAEELVLGEVAALRRAYAEMERRQASSSQAAKFQVPGGRGGGGRERGREREREREGGREGGRERER